MLFVPRTEHERKCLQASETGVLLSIEKRTIGFICGRFATAERSEMVERSGVNW